MSTQNLQRFSISFRVKVKILTMGFKCPISPNYLCPMHFPPCLYSTLGTITGVLELPAFPLTSVTWFAYLSLSDLCSDATFSVKSSLITLSKTLTPLFLFSVFPSIIFHTTSVCILLTVCLFPQEYKLHVSRIFFSPVVLFTTDHQYLVQDLSYAMCYINTYKINE